MNALVRRPLLVASAVALITPWLVGLSGCAAFKPGPRTVEIPEHRLVEAIAHQFPRSNRYLDLFDVTLSSPKVRLMPEVNRIGTQMDFTMGTPLVETRVQRGTLSLSYGLRLDPSDNTVRLDAVRMESLTMPDMPHGQAERLQRLGGKLVEGFLPDLVVYRLKPDDLRTVQGWGYRPGALRVVPGGLELQLDPEPR